MNFRVEFALWFQLSREIGVGSGESNKSFNDFSLFSLWHEKEEEKKVSVSKLRLAGSLFR